MHVHFTISILNQQKEEYAGGYYKMIKMMFMVSVTHQLRENEVLASFQMDYIFVL